MVENMIRVVEMLGENRWCINHSKERTIFNRDENEYIIYWVKDYAVKLLNIDTYEESDWINISDFQERYKETDYCLELNS